MKKVLLVTDGESFSEGAFEFARKMNEQIPILLSGVFLPQLEFIHNMDDTSAFVPITTFNTSSKQSIEIFKQQCIRYNIEFNIHNKLSGYALPELSKETRFADLMILGSEKLHGAMNLYGPYEYLNEALHHSECPAIVVPEKFTFPESVVLTYDGSASAAYAIRSFTYLFPQLCSRRALLIYGSEKNETEIPEADNILELVAHHFPNLVIQRLDVNPKKYFSTRLADINHPILVTGAYGRSAFSRSIKKSFISDIIQEHQLPIFIAHK